jgi:hypothetical protein
MAAAIPIAMLVVAAAGTAMTIAGNISANKTAERQAEQALRSNDSQLRLAESTGQLQAQQQSSDRTRRYNDIISSQTALWATRGIQLQSGTVSNIADQSTDAYNRDINTIELNRMNRLASIALQGADVQYAAANAVGAAHTRMVSGITSSLFSFAGSVIGGGTGAYKSAFGDTGTAAAAGGGFTPAYNTGAGAQTAGYGGTIPTGMI